MVHIGSTAVALTTLRAAGLVSSALTIEASPGYVVGGGGVLVSLLVAAWLRPKRKARPQGRVVRGEDWAAAAGEQVSQQDLLTGLPDRQALDAKLHEEWKRERKPDEPTALLLIGLDGFDALETASGKLAGDVALLTVARALGRMLPRKADLLARYEKSTFAVMLPGTDLPGALRVAARLRWSVVRLGITHPVSASGLVTVGLGVAVQHGVSAEGPTALVQAGHQALYRAQFGGVDRLEYGVVGQPVSHEQAAALSLTALPSIPAWSSERELRSDLPAQA